MKLLRNQLASLIRQYGKQAVIDELSALEAPVCMGCGGTDELHYIPEAGEYTCESCHQASIPEDVRHYG